IFNCLRLCSCVVQVCCVFALFIETTFVPVPLPEDKQKKCQSQCKKSDKVNENLSEQKTDKVSAEVKTEKRSHSK
ncbi:MAG: hypothetical protein CMR00_01095, partial [[Chlorobium] sp. 445]